MSKPQVTRFLTGGPKDETLEAFAEWIANLAGSVNPKAPTGTLLAGAERQKTEDLWKKYWEKRKAFTG